jgi:hypothetical protein
VDQRYRKRGGGLEGNPWGIWTGIAAIALVAFLGVLFILPWAEESKKTPTTTVEKTTPAPNSTPNPKQ